MQPYAYNYFPANYQPFNPYQQNYQQLFQGYQQASQQTQQNQPYTLPTIHAEIVQIDNEQSAMNFPVAVGASQMMIAKDDSAIFIKTSYPNGESKIDIYDKRDRQRLQADTSTSKLDEYVTIGMLESRIQEITDGLNRQRMQQIQKEKSNRESRVKENE
ncbi:MAG: hypothetical protein J6S85_13720 [Methanobrevibacter sp.]|nr:hypothetical protein [Methanobrevibacter sp.]